MTCFSLAPTNARPQMSSTPRQGSFYGQPHSANGTSTSPKKVQPISSLTPYQNRWGQPFFPNPQTYFCLHINIPLSMCMGNEIREQFVKHFWSLSFHIFLWDANWNEIQADSIDIASSCLESLYVTNGSKHGIHYKYLIFLQCKKQTCTLYLNYKLETLCLYVTFVLNMFHIWWVIQRFFCHFAVNLLITFHQYNFV